MRHPARLTQTARQDGWKEWLLKMTREGFEKRWRGIFSLCCGSIFSCGVWTWLWHVGSSSLAGDWTWAPCIGSMASQPLDQQGSPSLTISDGGQDTSSWLGAGQTEVKAPFRRYQKSITGKAIHMITLVLLKWEGVTISRYTSLGCTRETVSHFRDIWCYWGEGVRKWQSKQS